MCCSEEHIATRNLIGIYIVQILYMHNNEGTGRIIIIRNKSFCMHLYTALTNYRFLHSVSKHHRSNKTVCKH